MKKVAISNDAMASAFTNRLLKSQGLNPIDAPKIFTLTKDQLNLVDMSKNMLPAEMLEDSEIKKMISRSKRLALNDLSKSFSQTEAPLKMRTPFFKNWKVLLPSSIAVGLAAGGAYLHKKSKDEKKKKMRKSASTQRIIGMALRGYRLGVEDAEKLFEKEMGKKTRGLKTRLDKLTKGRSYKKLTKKAGGPGSGTNKDNTLPITDLKQSEVIRIGGRKSIIDTQPYDTKTILVSSLKYAAQDNYVPEKLNKIIEAMSKPDWVDKPIDVMEVDGEYHVLDGHHRALAAIKLKRKEILAKVYKGHKKKAFLEGFTKRARKEPSIDNTHFDRADIGRSVADDTIPSGVGIPATRRSFTRNDTGTKIERGPRSYGFEGSSDVPRVDPATKVVY